MPPLPILKVRVVLRILRHHGFDVVRQRGKGNHRFVAHPDGRTTTVSGNDGDDMPRGTLAKVIRDTRLSVEDFSSG
jgi:predicted RNA binding protein YcfA (HicA-like mRNA interferase family)